ncbi:MAG: hypothetical protein ABW205_09045 [Burkholderiales bacterium]
MIRNLPYTRRVLERIGCDRITPFTLTLAEWPVEPVETGMDGKESSAGNRQLFIALHRAACELLGVTPHAPDLRPVCDRTRTCEELKAIIEAYRWAGAAHETQVDDLRGILRRMEGDRNV